MLEILDSQRAATGEAAAATAEELSGDEGAGGEGEPEDETGGKGWTGPFGGSNRRFACGTGRGRGRGGGGRHGGQGRRGGGGRHGGMVRVQAVEAAEEKEEEHEESGSSGEEGSGDEGGAQGAGAEEGAAAAAGTSSGEGQAAAAPPPPIIGKALMAVAPLQFAKADTVIMVRASRARSAWPGVPLGGRRGPCTGRGGGC